MLLFVTLFAAAAATSAPARNMPVINPAPEAATCPETAMSLARKLGKEGPKAIPLNKLPAPQAFMAVDRHIGGCRAPLTMIEYRSGARR